MKKIFITAVSLIALIGVVACSSMNQRDVASDYSSDWDKHHTKMKNYPAGAK